MKIRRGAVAAPDVTAPNTAEPNDENTGEEMGEETSPLRYTGIYYHRAGGETAPTVAIPKREHR
jgi:hypothetical protein